MEENKATTLTRQINEMKWQIENHRARGETVPMHLEHQIVGKQLELDKIYAARRRSDDNHPKGYSQGV